MFDLELECERKLGASIKVIGVGGAGNNTVNSIIDSGCKHGIECIAINTDSQALEQSRATHKIQIGMKSTKGLGTGTDPELGRRSAEEDLDKIVHAVGSADIVFLAGGMGKGTGSGALPVIAHTLKELGILTIAVVTKPFTFEGKRRAQVAHAAIDTLQKEVDALIIIPNQKLLDIVGNSVPMTEAFSMINDVLSQSITGISDIITKPGHINVDFADVRAIIKDTGLAIMGTGKASGPERARQAALTAITSPILENMDIEGAKGVVLNITGGKDLGLHEISDAASVIYAKADENANIIIGSVIDESMTDEVSVTVIATGFNSLPKPQVPVQAQTQAPVSEQIVQQQSAAQQVVHEQPTPAVTQVQEQKPQAPVVDASMARHRAAELEKEAFEAEFLKEFKHELATKEQSKADVHEMNVNPLDLDVPAYLRRKSADQIQE